MLDKYTSTTSFKTCIYVIFRQHIIATKSKTFTVLKSPDIFRSTFITLYIRAFSNMAETRLKRLSASRTFPTAKI